MRALLSLALLGGSAFADDAVRDLPSLVAAMESLQGPIKDFRCEFDGRDVYKGDPADEVAKNFGPDGLIRSFGGVFVWQRDGDRRTDIFTRSEDLQYIQRESIIIHWRDRKVDLSREPNLAGAINFVDFAPLNLERVIDQTYFGDLLPLDEFKEMVGDATHETTVSDDEVDARPLKLLTVYLTYHGKIPNIMVSRYWIDMARSGQVVRIDGFLRGSLAGRTDIELKSFRVGEAEVWMPVAGEYKTYLRSRGRGELSEFVREPTMVRSIRVLEGTMEFNKKPAQAIFSLDHKPPAPKSDALRDWTRRFNQKIPRQRPTKAEAEAKLQEQLDEAAQEGRDLIAVPREGVNWWPWSVAGLTLVLAASLTALWMQRRPR